MESLPTSSKTLDAVSLEGLVGRRITVAGHFVGPVTLDGVKALGEAVMLRVRTPEGRLEETTIELSELADGAVVPVEEGGTVGQAPDGTGADSRGLRRACPPLAG